MKTIKIYPLTRDKVQFSIDVLEEDQPIERVLSFKETGADHSEYIEKVLNDNGYSPWLWCTVKVIARFGSFEGTAYLGACAYESEADFIKGGYYEQMQDEAFTELLKEFNRHIESIKVPSLIERIKNWLTPKFFRFAALSLMWGQMIAVLIYSAMQHPILKPFFER